jgi:hypothetical protein
VHHLSPLPHRIAKLCSLRRAPVALPPPQELEESTAALLTAIDRLGTRVAQLEKKK